MLSRTYIQMGSSVIDSSVCSLILYQQFMLLTKLWFSWYTVLPRYFLYGERVHFESEYEHNSSFSLVFHRIPLWQL
jgi:hypothetical protein